MLDCWKNNCHGATVVPTIATINISSSAFKPPGNEGTKPDAVLLTDGCTRMAMGIITIFIAMRANRNRSHRRNEPPATTANNSTADSGTEIQRGSPK
ncbi:Uncharacterised protein [Mycobacteroides abscessus subsp. abscessus]|nr:Uncharacterised protein [Mycobacteroides abscessus subsp. abscessus]